MLASFTKKRFLLILFVFGIFGEMFLFVETLLWKQGTAANAGAAQFYQSDIEKIARHWLIEALPTLPAGSDVFRIHEIRVLDCDTCYEVIYELGQSDSIHRLELGVRENNIRAAILDGATDILPDGSDSGLFEHGVIVTIEPLATGIGQEKGSAPNAIGIKVLKAVSDDFKTLPIEERQTLTVDLARKDTPRFLAEAVDKIRINEQRRITISRAQKGDLERALGKIFDDFSKLSFDIEAVAVNYP